MQVLQLVLIEILSLSFIKGLEPKFMRVCKIIQLNEMVIASMRNTGTFIEQLWIAGFLNRATGALAVYTVANRTAAVLQQPKHRFLGPSIAELQISCN